MRLLYFAWVREMVGVAEEEVAPPEDIRTVAELLDWLAARGVRHADAFGNRARLRAAVDQVFVPFETPLGTAREVAIFPPVTGG